MAGYHKISLNFDNIPKKNNHFSWIESIGKVVPYHINDTEYSGILTIINFIKPCTIIFTKDNESTEYKTNTQSLYNGIICFAFGKQARIYKYNVGDILLDQAIVLQQVLIEKQCKHYITQVVGYTLQCMKDKHQYDIEETALNTLMTKNGSVGCPVCSSRIIIPEINSFAALLPEIVDWFEDRTIPYHISRFSNQAIDIRCPYCGTPKKIKPMNIKHHVSCICGDGFSYPEKMFGALLQQLHVDYIYQLSKKDCDWCKQYRFDFYFTIDNERYIVELDGGVGHKNGRIINSDSVKRDHEKDNIIAAQGIHLIRIDVNYPNTNTRFEYIKMNIIDNLNTIFDLTNVDWNQIECQSEKSLFQHIIQIYNITNQLPTDIARQIVVDACTVVRYLKKGTKLGLCFYDPKDSQKKYIQKIKDKDIIHAHYVFLKVESQNFYHIHKTISDFAKNSKTILGFNISEGHIHRSLKNPEIKNRHHLKFSYATQKEYEDYINKSF